MDFRLTEGGCWIAAIPIAALAALTGMLLTKAEFSQPTSFLLLGLMPMYVLASSYVCLRLVKWLSGRRFFGRLIAVLLSAGFLLAASWIVFGAYFYLAAKLGYESTEHLRLDAFLRKTLQLQIGVVPILCALLLKKEGRTDFVASLVVATLILVFVIF